MKKLRLFFLSQSILSLIIGGFLYCFLFQDDPMGLRFTVALPFLRPDASLFSRILRFYAADFLWAYALFFALSLIWQKPAVPFAVLTVSGLFWEIGQAVGLFPGTFDAWDVMVYPAAGLIAVLILSFWRKNRHEKTVAHPADRSDRLPFRSDGNRQ